jgi:hypothetical protein
VLNSYLSQTENLLQNPAAPTTLYASVSLVQWINQARAQLAGESEAVKFIGSLTLAAGTRTYSFSAISIAGIGLSSVLKVEQIWLQSGGGQVWIQPRPWPWFSIYNLNNASPTTVTPTTWAQYLPGVNGSLYFDPIPPTSITALIDTVCLPAPLVTDSTAEAIPALWQDAVCYFAAYLALLSAQTGAREAYANRMFERYTEFVNRARRFATPGILPVLYPQNLNPGQAAAIATVQPNAGGNG